jgi:membrane-anchored protein YejM (alkaline phosphatase superfamily)
LLWRWSHCSPPGRSPDLEDRLRIIDSPDLEKHLNVVLVSVESLGAEFLGAWDNPRGLTPRLDALAAKSLVFGKVYATGNRTVRGLEALSLSLPPTPGQSMVKRPNNAHLFDLALREIDASLAAGKGTDLERYPFGPSLKLH